MGQSLVDLVCENCGKEFQRRQAEYKRSQRVGRRNFCSLACGGKQSCEHLIEYGKQHIEENTERILKCRKKVDEFSPFKNHLKHMKRHARSKEQRLGEVSISLRDLKDQWEKQKGICPYTGWEMYLPKSSSTCSAIEKQNRYNPRKASIDRIDSSKGYLPDNIQYVCYIANIAKNQYPGSFLIEFCKAVANYR
jgi:hypothetical protein